VALLAAGCHVPGTGSGSPGAGKLSQITVGATAGVADAPLYLAASTGLFTKAGLHVSIRTYSSVAAELRALQGGTLNVASADYADFLYAASNNPSLQILADGYDAAPNLMEVLTLPGSSITTPEQLAGKAIGTSLPQEFPFNTSVPYSMETMATQSVLLADGVEPTQVRWKAMPPQRLVGALRDHQVNAILVTEPYIFQAESQLGATEVLDALSGSTANLPLSGYFTTKSSGRAGGPALRAFRSVLLQAQGEAASGRGVRSVLGHYPRTNVQTADMVTLGIYPTSLNVSGVQQMADLMYSFGMTSQPLDASSMVFH
jgi:NitT/TauT family transport system substrate-binding protein